MKSSTSRLMVGGVVVAVAAATWLIGVQAQTPPSRGDAATMARLQAAADTRGAARVIVRLATPFVAEPLLDAPQAVGSQRDTIQRQQSRVLADTGAGARNIRRFETVPLLALDVDRAALETLRTSQDVVTIWEDTLDRPLLAESTALVGAPSVWSGGLTGAGWTVAVIDTGVDKNHPFLAGKVVAEGCYSTTSAANGSTSLCPGGAAATTAPGAGVPCSMGDCYHGTHVAGIAAGSGTSFAGVARGAGVLAFQVFSRVTGAACGAEGATCIAAFQSDQIAALERIYELRTAHNIAAINMSLGGGAFSTYCDGDARKPIIDTLRAAGIATVASSGNDGSTGALTAPACISSAISVGSVGDGSSGQTTDVVSSFSSSAGILDMLAPGAAITSSIPGTGFATYGGTSMAAPHVTGALAILRQQTPGLAVADAKGRMLTTGVPVTDTRNGLTRPRLNLEAAVSSACSFVVTPTSESVGAGGASLTATVTTAPGCRWTASSSDGWITIASGATGAGSGSVSYTVAQNPFTQPRSGSVTVAGRTIIVTQAAATCSVGLVTAQTSVPASGGSGVLTFITSAADCAWNAVTSGPWITLTSPSSGIGAGSVSYTVAAAVSSEQRVGTIVIGGQVFSITQAGLSCTFGGSTRFFAAPEGGRTTATVTASPADCAWTAVSQSPWLRVVEGASSVGPGKYAFTYDATTLSERRTGTLVVAGRVVTVIQSGVTCATTIAPVSASMNAAGGGIAVTVNANATDCAWTSQSQVPWITVASAPSGQGSGSVVLSVAANTMSSGRTGTVVIAGQTFTLTQAGVSCALTVSLSANDFSAQGGQGVLDIAAGAPDCSWQAAPSAPWISIISAAVGTGAGRVVFTVAPYALSTPRSGQITVNGLAATVRQTGVSCTYGVQPSVLTIGAAGGPVRTTVTTNAADCAWAVNGATPWMSASPASGAGGQPVTLFVSSFGDDLPRGARVTLGGQSVVVHQAARGDSGSDRDGDGLPDVWEDRFGLSSGSGVGEHGAAGDPDRDGSSNFDEYLRGSHPRGFYTRYLAEGATGSFFSTRVGVANPHSVPVRLAFRFLRNGQPPIVRAFAMAPLSRHTIEAHDIAGLEAAEFSTIIESDAPVAADRAMSWDRTGYGSHSERSIAAPSKTWYLAEGSTGDPFDLFYLVQNPTDAASQVRVKFVLASGQVLERSYDVPAASRVNIWVDQADAALANADVSGVIEVISGSAVLVERALYRGRPGQLYSAGHESAGAPAAAPRWYFAEGASGGFFDTFFFVLNPTASTASVRITYLIAGGQPVSRTFDVPPMRRQTIWADVDHPALAVAGFSTIIESVNGVPIVAERAMWWPGPSSSDWQEAHNVVGSSEVGTVWAIGDAESGGANQTTTYVLLMNPSSRSATVEVLVLFDNGVGPLSRTITVQAANRVGFNVADLFAPVQGRRYGVLVRSVGADPAEIVVERAMYSNANGVGWAAGSASLATRLAGR